MATVSSIGPPNVFDWTKIKMIIYRIILKLYITTSVRYDNNSYQ